MLAISPQFCSSGWFLDDPLSHEQQNMHYFSRERTETSDSIDLHSPSSRSFQPKNGDFTGKFNDGFINGGDGDKMAKKLSHNASERDRRKRINTLYAHLRSILPPQDQSRKLSIPATVSRVLKYIPELQKEMERLIQKKERLMSKISTVENSSLKFKNQKTKPNPQRSYSATRIDGGEIIIQSSMPKSDKSSFSEAIMRLEEEGFVMMNASSFESFQGRVFYNMHLQGQEGQVIDAEMLREKVWPFI